LFHETDIKQVGESFGMALQGSHGEVGYCPFGAHAQYGGKVGFHGDFSNLRFS
jgi:hypothetical protein